MKRERDRAHAPTEDAKSFDEDDVIALNTYLAQLDDDAQELMVGYFFEGCTLAQLAGRRGCSTTHVWNQIERGKSSLARRLERAGYATAVPLTGTWLESIPPSPPTPPVAAEVIARAKSLSVATPTAGVAAAGVFMAMNKASVALPLIGALCFFLGVGATRLLGDGKEDEGSSFAANDTTDAAPNRTAPINAATTNTDLEQRIAALQAANRDLELKLSASEAASDAQSNIAENNATPSPADALTARFEELSVWLGSMREELAKFDGRHTSPKLAELQERLMRELQEKTEGLRELMFEEPEALFAILDRGDLEPEIISVAIDVMIQKKRRSATAYSVVTSDASEIPPAIIDGVLDLSEKSAGMLRDAGLRFLMSVTNIEDRHVDRLREWIDSPDPAFAGNALRAFNTSARKHPERYDEALRRSIHETLRATTPQHDAWAVAAIESLSRFEDSESLTTLLDLMKSGRYPHQDNSIIHNTGQLMEKSGPNRMSEYAEALAAVASRATSTWSQDRIVDEALKLKVEYARSALEAVAEQAADTRATIIRRALEQLELGELSNQQIRNQYKLEANALEQ